MLARHRSPEILELRVHGVLNTPPAEMLQTTPDKITRRVGDELGAFWSGTDQIPAEGITSTEAFSWGAQARTGGGALAVISRVLVHLGWFLLLPYALANLAYWTRWIKSQTKARSKTWDGGPGAATVRVFGLLLTLIGVAAFSSVAIDLVAIQCFRDGAQVCAALPEVFDSMRGLTRDGRAALLGIAPIAAVIVLYIIGRRGRVRFEAPVKRFGEGLGDTPEEEGLPLLATRGFWSVSRVGQTSEWLHVAASIAMVLFVLTLDSAYVQVPGCWRGSATITQTCLTTAFDHPLPAWFAVGALLLLVVSVILVVYSSHTPAKAGPVLGRLGRMVPANTPEARSAWKRGAAMACLVLAVLGYAAWTILALARLTPQSDSYPGFLGLVATPIALIVVAFFLALAGVGWKTGTSRARRTWSAIFLVLGAVALLSSHFDAAMWGMAVAGGWQWWLILAAGICVLIHLSIAWTTPGERVHVAWRGQAAAVVMILALFASMALSSLLVLGVGAWLGTPAGSAPTDYIWRTPLEPVPAAVWNIPDAYERFAVILSFIAGLLLLLIVVAVGWNLIRFVRFSMPPLEWKDEKADTEGPIDALGGLETPDLSTYAPRVKNMEPEIRRRVSVRRSSHLLHRGEPLFGWLAVFAAIGFFSLSSSFVYEQVKAFAVTLHVDPAAIRGTATAILVAIAVAAVAAVAAHAASSSERPLGVFWDVVAFFPRAGHPFAPPCFGERAVPELSARAKSWVSDPNATRPRAVILTAHSMGSTIAAATLLSMRGEKVETGRSAGQLLADRLALLSYGSQLRAYFSRFFPSVFGPDVLGVPGLRGPSLWRRDPWHAQVLEEFGRNKKRGFVGEGEREPLPKPLQEDQWSLTAILGAHARSVPRWRNLWRRTDYLGFPVYAYRSDGNPVDLGTTESVPDSYLWQIGTHSNYLGTAQFLLARAELVKVLGRKAT
jgi:hypothetical protein